MRLCLATDSRAPSGMGAHMLALADALPDDDIAFLVRRDTPLFAAARARGLAAFDSARPADEVAGWLGRQGFDLVHVHAGIGWEGHGLTAAAAGAGLPVVRTEHLPCLVDDPGQRAHYVEAARQVALHIGVSEAVTGSWRESGLLTAPVVTVRNGIADAGAPSGVARFERQPGRPLMLNVGRLEGQKGQHLLLEAAALLAAEGALFDLVLVGDGPDRADLLAAIRALGLGGHVRLAGPRGDVPAMMRTADLLVHASAFEGLPLVLMEAMAAGLPIAALPAPGTTEVVDADTAFLAEGSDAAALASAIRAALAAPHERARRADAARARQAADFTARRMARETRAAYATIEKAPPVTTTRIGFIGAGGIAHRHIGVLEGMEDVAIVGVADLDEGRAGEAAERCGARSFADAAAMVAETRPDALFVCVPPFAHGPAERLALEHGLPFLVEKPIGLDLEETRAIAAEITRRGLLTGVGYHWRWLDTLDDVRGAMGERRPRLVSGYWLDSTPPPRWWWRQDMSGGQMTEQATHLVDLALYLVGDAVSVYGMAEHSARAGYDELDVATCSTAAIRFDSGAIGNFAATCLLGWNHRVGLHLFGDGFAIELTDRDVMIDVGAGRPVTGNRSDPVWHQDRAFIDAVQGHEDRIRCTYADALRTLEVADAIARSAASGEVVAISPAKTRLEDAA